MLKFSVFSFAVFASFAVERAERFPLDACCPETV